METKTLHELFRRTVSEANRLLAEGTLAGRAPSPVEVSFTEAGEKYLFKFDVHVVLACTREQFSEAVVQLVRTAVPV